jgi:hypothetical protein
VGQVVIFLHQDAFSYLHVAQQTLLLPEQPLVVVSSGFLLHSSYCSVDRAIDTGGSVAGFASSPLSLQDVRKQPR